MDLSGTLYSVFGVTEPMYLGIAALVALLLAISLSATVLETVRIYREYSTMEEPVPEPEKQALLSEKLPERQAEKAEKVDITRLGDIAAKQPAQTQAPAQAAPAPTPLTPVIDVIKGTLPESMKAVNAKYVLDSLTIASSDGLVVASTSSTPDEDAAVYSNLFYELHRTRPGQYFNVSNKDIHLLLVESGSQKVIDVVRKSGPMTQEEAAGLQDDTRKILDRFVWGSTKT